jgi:hypothetical protein
MESAAAAISQAQGEEVQSLEAVVAVTMALVQRAA